MTHASFDPTLVSRPRRAAGPSASTAAAPMSPWTLRAWPPILWQVHAASRLRLRHCGTRVMAMGDLPGAVAGQTLWAGPGLDDAHGDATEAGMAWDWVQVADGVLAMADPMSVVTNLRLVSDSGEVLTAHAAAMYLNEMVRLLPWQHAVREVLQGRLN
jgi:hypothetical protein